MEEKILAILVEICEDEIVKEDQDVDLFENGLLDSLAVIELFVTIEEVFGIKLAPTEIERRDFNTPKKIIAFLEEMKNE